MPPFLEPSMSFLERATPFLLLIVVILGIVYAFTKWSDVEKTKALARVEESKNQALIETNRGIAAQSIQQAATIQLQIVAGQAALLTKQAEGTAAVTTAVTGAKTDVTAAVEKSGADVIEKVETSKDEVIAVVRLLAKVNTGIFKPAGAEPPDLATMKLILEETYSAIEAAQAKAAGLAAQIAATPEAAAIAPAQPAAEDGVTSELEDVA